MMLPAPLSVAAGAMLGLVIGSFLATLILRWLAGQSILGARSHCDGCQTPLRWYQLVPLFAYVWQRARCPHCQHPIDPLHPLVEILAALIGAGALWLRPDLGGVALALFGWQLLTLAILDGRALWLPDPLTATLAVTGAVLGGVMTGIALPDRLIGGAAGFASLAVIGWGYRTLRGREGMGGGDPKLFGAIGLWLGWQALPMVLLFAALAGIALSLPFVGRPDWRSIEIALGSLLAIAAGILGTLMAGGWA